MSVYLDTVIIGAIFFALLFIFFLLFTFLLQYRRNNYFSIKESIISLIFIFYILVAYFLVILPLPDLNSFTSNSKLLIDYMQLNPMYFFQQIIHYFNEHDFSLMAFLKAPPVYTTLFNVVLLYPLGVFLRNYFRISLFKTVIIGFLVSLSFELLQLSGLLFIYPHPYRLFDVDDLIMNTLGAFLGGLSYRWYQFLFLKPEVKTKPFKVTVFKQFIIVLNDIVFVYFFLLVVNIIISVVSYYVFNTRYDNDSNFFLIINYTVIIIYFIIPLFTKHYQTLAMKIADVKIDFEHNTILVKALRTFLIYFPFFILSDEINEYVRFIYYIYVAYYLIHFFVRKEQMNIIDRKLNATLVKINR